MSDEFTVYITHEAWLKMSALARECSHEISGLAKVKRDTDADMVVHDVCCLPQNGSGASTHIDMEEVAKFLTEDIAARKGKKKAQQTEWLCWWHSHPGGGKPSYSSTDDSTLEDLANSTEGSDLPLFIGVVIGGDGEQARSYLGLRWPCKAQIEGDVVVLTTDDEAAATVWAKEQIKEKVKPATARVVKSNWGPCHQPQQGKAQPPLAAVAPMTGGQGLSRGSDHWHWWEGDRYKWDTKNQIYHPDPMYSDRDKDTQLATNPLRAEDGRPVLLRHETVPTGTHPKLSTAEKAIRKSLDEAKIIRGEMFKVDADIYTMCVRCGEDAISASEINFCLGCERDESHCACKEKAEAEEVDVCRTYLGAIAQGME